MSASLHLYVNPLHLHSAPSLSRSLPFQFKPESWVTVYHVSPHFQASLAIFIPPDMPSSTKKWTTAKKQQPLSALLLSAPATTIISDPNPTATAKISAVNFCIFIQHAKSDNIEKFLKLTLTTQDGWNLAFFWEQAYDWGYTEGRADVLREELNMASKQLQDAWMRCG